MDIIMKPDPIYGTHGAIERLARLCRRGLRSTVARYLRLLEGTNLPENSDLQEAIKEAHGYLAETEALEMKFGRGASIDLNDSLVQKFIKSGWVDPAEVAAAQRRSAHP